jgi:TP901 family phage tail tape measure protein
VAERSLRYGLFLDDKTFGKGLRDGGRKADRFGRDIGRSFDRAGDAGGRRFGLRLNKSLGGGMSASAGIVRKGAGLIGAGFAAAGIASFAKDAVNLAATFDKTMRQTAQVAKVPAKQMKELRDVALDMGAKTSFSAREAGNAMLALGKGGLTFAEMKAGALSSTLTLAAAGGLELGQSAEFVVQGLRTFGLRADKAADVAAALAGAANASTSSVEDMGLALSQTGAGARNAGLSIQQTTGVLAAFANNGIKGSDAGTSLKTMLQRLIPSTKAAKDKMAELNLSFVDSHGAILPITHIAQQLQNRLGGLSEAQRTAALQTIFGSDATRAATILMREGHAGLAKYIKATNDRSAAEKLAKTNTEGAAGAFERLQGAIETVKIKAGTTILPMLADVATTIADRVIPAISRWVTQFRTDLLPHLGRMRDAWDANKGAIAGLVTGLAGSESQLTSTGDKAKTLADSVVALANAAGDASRLLDTLGGGLNNVESASDSLGSSIHTGVVKPFADWFRQTAIGAGGLRIFNGIVRDTKADLADVGIKLGATATETGKAATAADRHTIALRAEKDAVNALKDALAGEKTASLDVRQAKLNLSTAQARLSQLTRDGRKGSLEYKQAQIDLERAQIALRRKTDEYKAAQAKANVATSGAMRATQQAQPPMTKFGDAAKTAGGKARLMGQLAKEGINMIPSKTVTVTGVAKIDWTRFNESEKKHRAQYPFHSGGVVPGAGTGDKVPAALEPGEVVWPNREPDRKRLLRDPRVRARLGFQRGGVVLKTRGVDTIDDKLVAFARQVAPRLGSSVGGSLGGNLRKVLAGYADRFAKAALKKFLAAGGGKPAIKAFIKSVDPLPYIWGGAGPGGYDCSGLASAVYGKHTGRGGGRGQRYFTTATIGTGVRGLKSGLGGVLQIGVTPGQGHMAGRYGGLGFEAESTRTGIKIGSAASRPESFARHFHMAKGGLVDQRMVAALAGLPGVDIGGDEGHLRLIRGPRPQTFDRGGTLQPGLNLLANRTGRPEPLAPAGRLTRADADLIAAAFMRALERHPVITTVQDVDAAVRRRQGRLGQARVGLG